VVSTPQSRNRGYIRRLLSKILKDEKEKGKIVSILMPFKYKFYQKFGYGYLGGATATKFEPDNIDAFPLLKGKFVKFNGKKEHLTAMYDVHDIWVRNFTGGIESRRLRITKFKEYIKRIKNHLFLYFKNNECKAYILFRFNYKEFHESEIIINKTAWKDNEGFRGILNFLKTHRDQCQHIEWNVPRNIPFHILCKNPRISQKLLHDFMIRPLDVEKILALKADYTPAIEKITFSIEDPVIPGNSGTYIIEDKEVKKIPLTDENTLPFHIFSSLVVGAISLKEAELIGLNNISLPVTAYSFFQKNKNTYISECF
jgi:predicted acetyltransferase